MSSLRTQRTDRVLCLQDELRRAQEQQQEGEAVLASKSAELEEMRQKSDENKARIAEEMRRYAAASCCVAARVLAAAHRIYQTIVPLQMDAYAIL